MTSAREIEKAILVRIGDGAFSPGTRLPTCEQFAAELRVNKNTVSKAYRSLSGRGYLRTAAGRGTFVVQRPPKVDSAAALSDVTSLLALVVQEAKLSGIGRGEFRAIVDETTARYYDGASLRVGFIECNRLDATTLSRDLQMALSLPVEPLLIEDVVADVNRYMHSYDILAVNLFHLVVLEDSLRQVEGPDTAEIVALMLSPDLESLTQVARLRAATRLGIVCDLSGTLHSLSGIVAAYNPGVHISGALMSDDHALRKLIRAVDVILVTPPASEALNGYLPRVPLIGVSFKVDERSVQQLAVRIAERQRRNDLAVAS
jgi:DNA-binding transcriptional regulator YhcF (GntR family)